MWLHQNGGINAIRHLCSVNNIDIHTPVNIPSEHTRFHWGGGCKKCLSALDSITCPFCKSKMLRKQIVDVNESSGVREFKHEEYVMLCVNCGWWKAIQKEKNIPATQFLLVGIL